MKEENKNVIAWEKISNIYQQSLGGLRKLKEIHYGPLAPYESELKLIGNIKGKKVLEIGCGAGQNSIAFAKKGARVTGIDASREQIFFGKKLAEFNKVKVKFIQGSIQTIPWIKPNSIDLVFSAFALQYIKNLKKCFKEVYRILKRQGIFVFSLDHPIWFSGKWKKNRFVWENYWNKKIETNWKKRYGVNVKVVFFPHTVEEIFEALMKAGFLVERILEPKPKKRKNKRRNPNYSFKKLSRIPATIIFKAIKK